MNKKKKINRTKVDTVRSVNNNIRSSVRKLNPILKAIVGKKVDVAIRELQFSAKAIIVAAILVTLLQRLSMDTEFSAITNSLSQNCIFTTNQDNRIVKGLLGLKQRK